MALSGLYGASVGGCQISSVHTVALCPARGCDSMGPLMGLSSCTLPRSTRPGGEEGGGGEGEEGWGRASQHLAGMQNHVPRDKTKATLSSVYWKLISSPPRLFAFIKKKDVARTHQHGQSKETQLYRSNRSSRCYILDKYLLQLRF